MGKRHAEVKGRVGISNPAFKRIARQAGIKRISKVVYEQLGKFSQLYMQRLASNAVVLSEHAKRKTVTSKDIHETLKKMGRPIYLTDTAK